MQYYPHLVHRGGALAASWPEQQSQSRVDRMRLVWQLDYQEQQQRHVDRQEMAVVIVVACLVSMITQTVTFGVLVSSFLPVLG